MVQSIGGWFSQLVGGSVNPWVVQSIGGSARGVGVGLMRGAFERALRVGFSLCFFFRWLFHTIHRLCKPSRSEEFPGPQRRLVEAAAFAADRGFNFILMTFDDSGSREKIYIIYYKVF